MSNTPLKTTADLAHVVYNVLPNASFDTDNDGQIIIYTNLRASRDSATYGELVSLDQA